MHYPLAIKQSQNGVWKRAAGGFSYAAAMLEAKAGYYECPHCKALFVPTMGEYVKGYHTLTKRKLTCQECKKTGWCKHRIIR